MKGINEKNFGYKINNYKYIIGNIKICDTIEDKKISDNSIEIKILVNNSVFYTYKLSEKTETDFVIDMKGNSNIKFSINSKDKNNICVVEFNNICLLTKEQYNNLYRKNESNSLEDIINNSLKLLCDTAKLYEIKQFTSYNAKNIPIWYEFSNKTVILFTEIIRYYKNDVLKYNKEIYYILNLIEYNFKQIINDDINPKNIQLWKFNCKTRMTKFNEFFIEIMSLYDVINDKECLEQLINTTICGFPILFTTCKERFEFLLNHKDKSYFNIFLQKLTKSIIYINSLCHDYTNIFYVIKDELYENIYKNIIVLFKNMVNNNKEDENYDILIDFLKKYQSSFLIYINNNDKECTRDVIKTYSNEVFKFLNSFINEIENDNTIIEYMKINYIKSPLGNYVLEYLSFFYSKNVKYEILNEVKSSIIEIMKIHNNFMYKIDNNCIKYDNIVNNVIETDWFNKMINIKTENILMSLENGTIDNKTCNVYIIYF